MTARELDRLVERIAPEARWRYADDIAQRRATLDGVPALSHRETGRGAVYTYYLKSIQTKKLKKPKP